MNAKKSWAVTFVWFTATEVICLLYGASLLSNSWEPWLPAMWLPTMLIGSMIEGLQFSVRPATEKKWLRRLNYAGALYFLPMHIAVWARINLWCLGISLAAFALLVWRMLWLWLRFLRPNQIG